MHAPPRTPFLTRPGLLLAAAVVLIALFNFLAELSMPVASRRVTVGRACVVLALMLLHAVIYGYGQRLRGRYGLWTYVAGQAVLVFALVLIGELFPVGLALYLALTVELILFLGEGWVSLAIVAGAIICYASAAALKHNLYMGANAGLVLATAGMVLQALMMLWRRRYPSERARRDDAVGDTGATLSTDVTASNGDEAVSVAANIRGTSPAPNTGLTAREAEVLQALARGARSSEIAEQLAITERTVKAHLASIYRKLGVESRTAAVAAAHQRGLV